MQKLCRPLGAILMIDTVESISANSLLKPLVGTGIGFRRQRHGAMKAGVEDGDLRHRTEELGDDFHTLEFGAIVERGKSGNIFNRRLDFGGHDCRFEILRAAMHHAMANHIDFRKAGNCLGLAAPQTLEQAFDRFAARLDGSQIVDRDTIGVLDRILSLIVDPLDLPLPKAIRGIVRERVSNFVETALLAAGAGIENQDFHSRS